MRGGLEFLDAEAFEVVVRSVVEAGQSGGIFGESFGIEVAIPFGHTNYYALTRASEQHPVGIEHIFAIFAVVLGVPLVSAVEFIILPTAALATHVGVPKHAGIVEFKPLHLYLGCRFLKVVGRTDIGFIL